MPGTWRLKYLKYLSCLLVLAGCNPCFAQTTQAQPDGNRWIHLEAGRERPEPKPEPKKPVMSPIRKASESDSIKLVRLTSTDIPAPVRQACYSVARVRLDSGNSSQMGSATYLGNGLWLTNRHVVEGGGGRGRYSVKLKTGQTLEAKVTSISKGNADLAVVETVDLDGQVEPVPISNDEPRPGMVVYPSGFDHGNMEQHICWPAQIVGMFADGAIESEGLSARKGSISGNSGGPTFTAAGELLAPLYANGGQGSSDTAVGTGTCITVNSFACRTYLLPWRERIMRSLTGRGGCYGGGCQPQMMQPQYQQGPVQPPQYLIPSQPQQPQPQANTLPSYQPQYQPQYQPPSYQPAPQLQPAPPAPQPQTLAGPKGDKGDQGPAGVQGPKGDPGEITEHHLALIASKLRESMANDPSLRGPAGPPGPAGVATNVDHELIVQEVLRRMPGMRVVLVDGNTKRVIDDETYKPGEALVFDINKLMRSAK